MPNQNELTLSDNVIEAMRESALAAFKANQIEESLKIFRNITRCRASDERSYVDTAICLIALGRATEARDLLINALDECIEEGIWRWHALYQLAQIYKIEGNLNSTLEILSRANEIKSVDPSTAIEMLQIAIQTGDYKFITQHLSQAEKTIGIDSSAPHSHQLRHLKADLAWQFGEVEEALALLRQDLDIAWSPFTARKLVHRLANYGRESDAAQALEELLRKTSGGLIHYDALAAYIDVQMRCGRIQNVISVVELASQFETANPSVRHILFELYVTTLQNDKAKYALRQGAYDLLLNAKLSWISGRIDNAKDIASKIADDERAPFSHRNIALQLMLNAYLVCVELDRADMTLHRRINLNKHSMSTIDFNPLYKDRISAYKDCEIQLKEYSNASDIENLVDTYNRHKNILGHTSICCSSLVFMKLVYSKFFQYTLSHHDYAESRRAVQRIPKNIMQYWDQKERPVDILPLMARWKDTSVGYSYNLFDYQSAVNFMKCHSDRAILERFQRSSHPAMRSDIFRMAWLHSKGGFYIDADEYRATEPMAFSLDTDVVLPIVNHDDCHIQNGFMGSIPNSWLTSNFLDNIAAMAPEAFESGLVWWLTGPGHLTRLVASHLAQRIARNNAYDATGAEALITRDLVIFPKSLIEVEMFTPELQYKRTSLSWQKARADEQKYQSH